MVGANIQYFLYCEPDSVHMVKTSQVGISEDLTASHQARPYLSSSQSMPELPVSVPSLLLKHTGCVLALSLTVSVMVGKSLFGLRSPLGTRLNHMKLLGFL